MTKVVRRWLVNPETVPMIGIYDNYADTLQIHKIEKYFIDDKGEKCFVKEERTSYKKGDGKGRVVLASNTRLQDGEDQIDVFNDEATWSKSFESSSYFKVIKDRHSFIKNGHRYNVDIYGEPNYLGIVEVEFDSQQKAELFERDFWFGKEITGRDDYSDLNIAVKPKKFFAEIVLTGGPCGGKSSILAELSTMCASHGYKLLISPEVATDIMGRGISPRDLTPYEFQTLVVSQMLSNETNMRIAAYEYYQQQEEGEEKTVLVCYDRGLIDNLVYCKESEYATILRERGLTVERLNHRVDGVLNIVTTAYGAEAIYDAQKSNNSTRHETPEEARKVQDGIDQAYSGANNLHVIGNTEKGWVGKVNDAFNAVLDILNHAPIVSLSRRWLVSKPRDIEAFVAKYRCRIQQIEQYYLQSGNPNIEHRIRKIGSGKDWAYYETLKKAMPDGQVGIKPELISKDMYRRLLTKCDGSRAMIRKTRYNFSYNGLHYYLDIYDKNFEGLKGKVMLGTKGHEENAKIQDLECSVPPELFGPISDIEDISKDPMFEYRLTKGGAALENPNDYGEEKR